MSELDSESTSAAASDDPEKVIVASPPVRGELTPAAVVCAIVVAAIMGASYPYMVLKLGFGPNVSVVAAFFGFIFLNLIAGKTYDRWQNNIVQTAGTSAAQTAFMCVLLGAFDILRSKGIGFGLDLTWWKSFIWLTVAGGLGVLMAVPLRRHFIVDEKLRYADGVAAAETLVVLDPPRGAGADPALLIKAKQAARALLIGLAASAVMMFIREDAFMLARPMIEGWTPAESWTVGGVILVNMGVGAQFSLLNIGSGMLIGLRIDWSMILGGILAWVIAPWLIVKYQWMPPHKGAQVLAAKDLDRTYDVLFWVMWPATGMLVAGGLTALALRWRILIDTFKSLRGANLDSRDFPLKWVGAGCAVLAVLLCVVQRLMLDMPVWMTLAAIVLSLPLMLVGLRVLGETSWAPISALSNMMQGLFAAVAPGNVAANMVASGTTGTIAVSSETIMQDFKAGYMIGSTPRAMTWAQLMGVPIGALMVSLVYPALVKTYGLIGKDAKLSSPISKKWAGFAELLKKGAGSLPPSALWALVAFSLLGVVLTVLESRPRLKPFVPSPTGMGIGILVPFKVIATMFLGGLAGVAWRGAERRTYDQYMVPLASGFIAGEAIVAVIIPVLLWLGLGHPG